MTLPQHLRRLTNTNDFQNFRKENLKLLTDGRTSLACTNGLILEDDNEYQAISATSNPKYAPKVLGKKYNSLQDMITKNHNPYANYSAYSWGGSLTSDNRWEDNYFKKVSTAQDARSTAKQRLLIKGHKVKFTCQKEDSLMVGECKYCHKSAFLMFVPHAGEYVFEGKAFGDYCTNYKKVDTVSTPAPAKVTMTPLKASDVIARDREVIGYFNQINHDPAVALPNQGFDIDISNYPVGTDKTAKLETYWDDYIYKRFWK